MKDKKENLSNKEIDKLNFCHFADADYFYEMHYLSILLIIYTMFENLLSNLVKDIAFSCDTSFDNEKNSSPYINRYIYFLRNHCRFDLDISKEQWQVLNSIRKVRNNYLHNLDIDISQDLLCPPLSYCRNQSTLVSFS